MDLNLLTVFVALMQERSVTRAARRLSIGQPAMSHALARLRRAMGDDLLVRHGRMMEPTPRACKLLTEIGPALHQIEASLRTKGGFDPQTSRPVFRIGMSDDILLAYLPLIVSDLMASVPGAALIVLPSDYIRAADLLDRGDVATVLGYLERLPATARVKRLRTMRYKILSGARMAGRMTLDAYCQRQHAVVTFAGDLKGYIDDSLAERGARRTIVLSLPQFAGLPPILAATELLVTVPDFVADTLAANSNLHTSSLPFKSPTCGLSMAWRATVENDPAERFLRAIIARVITGKAANAALVDGT